MEFMIIKNETFRVTFVQHEFWNRVSYLPVLDNYSFIIE